MPVKPRIFSNIVENPDAKPPSNYGPRIDPISGGSQFHNGVDISIRVIHTGSAVVCSLLSPRFIVFIMFRLLCAGIRMPMNNIIGSQNSAAARRKFLKEKSYET